LEDSHFFYGWVFNFKQRNYRNFKSGMIKIIFILDCLPDFCDMMLWKNIIRRPS